MFFRGIVVISDFINMQNDNYILKNTLTGRERILVQKGDGWLRKSQKINK
jgi:hypothetical protein